MKKLIVIILLSLITFQSIDKGLFVEAKIEKNNESLIAYYEEYINKNMQIENMVTSIYLDYRAFDSIFEALCLMIITSSIGFILRRDKR